MPRDRRHWKGYNNFVLGGAFKISLDLHSARILRVRQHLTVRMQIRAFLLVPMENWKFIPGYEGRYEVSDHGRVRNRTKELAQAIMRSGHLTVHLGRQTHYVHRLVLFAFVGVPLANTQRIEARHLDGNPANNNLANLAWGTVVENRADRRRLGEKAKLSYPEMLNLQQDLRGGMLLKDVAMKYGVERHTAAKYRDGRMYG